MPRLIYMLFILLFIPVNTMAIEINDVQGINQQDVNTVVQDGTITIGNKSYSVQEVGDNITVRRQGLNRNLVKRFFNAMGDFFTVVREYARAFFAPVLKGVQAQVGKPGGILMA